MAQDISFGFQRMLDEALTKIITLSPSEAMALVDDPKVTFVDVRDPRERQREGVMPGALSCPRGMLEFWIDPASPYHKPQFAENQRFVFFCAGGWRSALATETAQRMGLKPVAHIDGGFKAWREAGGAVEPVSKP